MNEADFSIRGEFPAVSYDEWRKLAEADLQGASFEQKLVSHTYEAIDIQPVYSQRDHSGEGDPEGFPGLPPFVRAPRPPAPFAPAGIFARNTPTPIRPSPTPPSTTICRVASPRCCSASTPRLAPVSMPTTSPPPPWLAATA